VKSDGSGCNCTGPLAVWEEVELAHRLGIRRLILEGDALEIVQMLKNKGDCGMTYE
jgi:hypothetical protein